MKTEQDLKHQLYLDQILPIYVLQDKLKANFTSIQRRFKQIQQRTLNQQTRITNIQNNKPLFNMEQIDLLALRKQITNQLQNKFKQMKLQLPAQIKRQSQSLISTQLISLRRMISQSTFTSKESDLSKTQSESANIQNKIQQYDDQRQLKLIQQARQQISKLRSKVMNISEQLQIYKKNTSTQLSNINTTLNKNKQTLLRQVVIVSQDNKSIPIKQQQNITTSSSDYSKYAVLQEQIYLISSKLLNLLPRTQYDQEHKKTKQSLNSLQNELSLISKQLQNNDEIHSMILKINSNVQHYSQKHEEIKLLVSNMIVESQQQIKKNIQKLEQTTIKRISSSNEKQQEMDEINQRVLQLERLNNYDQNMESLEKILDKHYIQQPENPKRTLYLDYINHLEKKVEDMAKQLKIVHQRFDIEVQGTKLLEVSKVDIQQVWKAIMILENIIENKSDLRTSRRKMQSQSKPQKDESKQDNTTHQKGTQTIYIRRTDTHRAGGFGQKVSSSKNIRHLIDEKPDKLQRNRQKRQVIKFPQLYQQKKSSQQNNS